MLHDFFTREEHEGEDEHLLPGSLAAQKVRVLGWLYWLPLRHALYVRAFQHPVAYNYGLGPERLAGINGTSIAGPQMSRSHYAAYKNSKVLRQQSYMNLANNRA